MSGKHRTSNDLLLLPGSLYASGDLMKEIARVCQHFWSAESTVVAAKPAEWMSTSAKRGAVSISRPNVQRREGTRHSCFI